MEDLLNTSYALDHEEALETASSSDFDSDELLSGPDVPSPRKAAAEDARKPMQYHDQEVMPTNILLVLQTNSTDRGCCH